MKRGNIRGNESTKVCTCKTVQEHCNYKRHKSNEDSQRKCMVFSQPVFHISILI